MADYPTTKVNSEVEEGVFDLRKIWSLFYLNWYWVLLSVILCVSVSWVYLRFETPVYRASMKMLVKDSDKGGYGARGMALEGMGLMSNSNGFENELEIICSASLSTRLVKNLKLYTKYFLEGTITNDELYKNSPVLLDLEEAGLNALQAPLPFVVTKTDKGFRLEGYFDRKKSKEATFVSDVQHLPDTIPTPYGKLYVAENDVHVAGVAGAIKKMQSGKKLFVTIYTPQSIGRAYSNRLSASPTSKTTTVANVGLSDTKPQRALDYLSGLVNCYNEDANEDKNEVARKTEEFLAERLDGIKRELDITEGSIESYKKSNELINLANDATTALQTSQSYKRELAVARTQYGLMKKLVDYMNEPANYLQVIPANLGLEGGSMVSQLIEMMTEYNGKVLTRNRYLRASGEDNPLVVQMTAEISDMWPNIRNSMTSILQDMEDRKNKLEDEYNAAMGRIQETPTQERMLTGIARQQALQSELYLTLLQKREENFIQLYSTAAKGRVIDAPVVLGKISPKVSMVLMMAFALGVAFPVGVLLLMEMLRVKINGREDIENRTQLPILADIPLDKGSLASGAGIAVKENQNNALEEGFRGLRTNMFFCLKPKEQVIIATSCIPGEGKTFVSANLAMSLACLGKKVIIVGLDIRKPRLVSLFGLKSKKLGLTNFLSIDEADYDLLEAQIMPSEAHKNLDVLPAGIIPPNPAELIGSSQLDKAVGYLRTRYDYVILDTPPITSVADTFMIGRVAELTLVVLRADYSLKSNIKFINEVAEEHKLPNCNLVLNAVDITKRTHAYRYGYYSYYHYSYGKYNYGNSGGSHVEK